GAEPRARRVPVARRRRPLGPRPAQERARRRRRPLDGHAEPARPVRGGVGGAAHAVGHDERRAGVVAVEDDGRRRQLDRHLAKPRAAARHARADRRRRLSRRRPARLRGRRGRGRRLVPLRRRRRHVAARQRGGRATRPPVVLHARLRGSGGRRHRLGRGLLAVEVDRRRQDVRRGRHAPRRQPRPLDRSGEQPTDDRGQRRRRLRLLQQRAVVVDDLQPADRAGQERVISVWPEAYGMGTAPAEHRYRFQWTFPVFYSRWDARELWIAGNRVFRSLDDGQSWEIASPDLTRNDGAKLGLSGGPVTRDNTGAEVYCTIFALVESPHERDVLWAGTDDGLVHLSRDRGRTWQPVTPPDLPEWALISVLEPSPHDAATCYVAATCYKLDDTRPYLFKTSDYGRTWKRNTNGLPDDEITRVIREDPNRRGLLYCGTETKIWVSLD